ncbi:ABC transporter permease [Enterococcus raffinosus]|uniref:ABC transporter permease n=1 Tax=Enterococcus raffinosus TaxID=71452 RepID=UPI001C454A64|nr:ABC transporter permease [Enterococcus raffinosus]MDT2570938.1 ABC transporter permease [Enterococcus raffinosus]QXJ59975.1 ABC transporter permease [Enterococcus raffinosus]
MKFYVNWRSSLGSIFKNKKRSVLTMFGIVIGIAAVIAILSIGRGFERDTIESLTASDSEKLEVNINFVPSNQALYYSNIDMIQASDFSILKNVDGVESVSYPKNDLSYIYKDVKVKDKTKNYRVGVVSKKGKAVRYGRTISMYDNQTQNKVVTIDSALAKELFGSAKGAVGRGFELDGQVFTIIGVFPSGADETMFSMGSTKIQLPRQTYIHFFGNEQDKSAVVLTLADGSQLNKVADKAIKKLESAGAMRQQGEYQVSNMAMMTDGISEVLNSITLFISAVAGISLFIAGVGVMNMMYISVSERTKEIGIRRALGATRGAIRMQFLLEGMTLTLVGGLIGYLLGMIVAYAIGNVMDISVTVDLFTVCLAVGVSSGIGLIFSVMPASEAAKKDLIDILR